MLKMLMFNMYFHAWPISRLLSLKFMASHMKQVLHHFIDHSQGLTWNIECNFKSLLVKNKVSFIWTCTKKDYQNDNRSA